VFDQYLIVQDSLRNVVNQEGSIDGFELKIRIPYYRGVPLSCIDSIEIKVAFGVDGGSLIFTNDNIRFTVAGGSFTMKEMETVATRRWNFDEDATLHVYRPGGLIYLDQSVDLTIAIRAPYGRFIGHDQKRMSMGADLQVTA
jgi:hypothetical protein